MNSVSLLARITKDLELMSTQSGSSVLKFSVAKDTGYGDNKKSNFFNCVAFGKTAEFISKYFGKGSLIGIEGSLSDGSYDGKNGRVYKTDIIVREVSFTGENPKTNTNAAKGYDVKPQQNNTVAINDISDFEEILSDDGVPF